MSIAGIQIRSKEEMADHWDERNMYSELAKHVVDLTQQLKRLLDREPSTRDHGGYSNLNGLQANPCTSTRQSGSHFEEAQYMEAYGNMSGDMTPYGYQAQHEPTYHQIPTRSHV